MTVHEATRILFLATSALLVSLILFVAIRACTRGPCEDGETCTKVFTVPAVRQDLLVCRCN